MATPAGAEHRDLEQRFRALEQKVSDLLTANLRRQPVESTVVEASISSIELPADVFTEVLDIRRTVTPPDGYSRALVSLSVDAGTTFTAAGNVGVQPLVAMSGGRGRSNGVPGPSPVSVGSFMARRLFYLDQVGDFDLRLFAYATGAGRVADTGNVGLSALILFLR